MSSPLLKVIARNIQDHGPMDLGEYMTLCLSHPEHGYYMTRDPFGRGGDFITAPEVSQLFGEMIGVWFADLWIKMGSPPEFVLLECGPGRGTLMADILRATKSVKGFHEAAQIHLMEISPVLKAAQKAVLDDYDPHWIDDLSVVPASFPVLIVANEFLDALPVRQLERRGGQWMERTVSLLGDDMLMPSYKPLDDAWKPDIIDNGKDGVFEISLVLNQVIKSVDILLKKQGGAALFIDYGHTQSAMGDTLQAVKTHRFASIFDTPGESDITAHVDFENIEKIATADGVNVHGPVTQSTFLIELGIRVRAEALKAGAKPDQAKQIEEGLIRLIDTAQMGTLFKVLALCDDPQIMPAGFHESL